MILKGQKYKLYDIFKLLQSFEQEGHLQLTDEGLKVRQPTMDNTQLLELHVYDKLDCEPSEDSYCVNYKDMKSALRRFKKKDDITMTFTDVVEIASDSKKFTKPIYDTPSKELPPLNPSDALCWESSFSEFRDILDDASVIKQDSVELTLCEQDGKLAFKAGTDRDNYTKVLDVSASEDFKVMYGLDLLTQAAKSLDQVFSNAKIGIDEGSPMYIECENTYATAKYWVTPRVENYG